MTPEEQRHYEQILVSRLEQLPKFQHSGIRRRLESMSEENRAKLLSYLHRRFPSENKNAKYNSVVDEIDSIVSQLPEYIRDRIDDAIRVSFQEASPFVEEEDQFKFPQIPAMIDIREVVSTSENVRARVDEFLSKREEWRQRWDQLTDKERAAFEKYIQQKMT